MAIGVRDSSSATYGLSITSRKDGSLEVAYIRVSATKVARTEEIVESAMMLDWDKDDQLVGIEFLAPVKRAAVLRIASKLAKPRQASFKKFVQDYVPAALIGS